MLYEHYDIQNVVYDKQETERETETEDNNIETKKSWFVLVTVRFNISLKW